MNIIKHQGKIYSPVEADGFRGFREIVIPEYEPRTEWIGERIPLELWHRICAFFEWSYAETKSETQVRLFHNRHTGEWKAWAFPQARDTGMTTRELGDHAWWAEQSAAIGVGFVAAGTIHHHCKCGAFQSGTDKSDEQGRSQNGLHITVGHIGSRKYDLHARVVLNGFQCDADLEEWFNVVPEAWLVCPAVFHKYFTEYMLKAPPPEGTAFPDQWKLNLIKEERVVGFRADWQGGHQASHADLPGNGGPNSDGHYAKHKLDYEQVNDRICDELCHRAELFDIKFIDDMVACLVELGDRTGHPMRSKEMLLNEEEFIESVKLYLGRENITVWRTLTVLRDRRNGMLAEEREANMFEAQMMGDGVVPEPEHRSTFAD